jgi:hypothetical protein
LIEKEFLHLQKYMAMKHALNTGYVLRPDGKRAFIVQRLEDGGGRQGRSAVRRPVRTMAGRFASFLFVLFLSAVCARAQTADSALANLYKQLMIFPQEKIYIQTDRPYYLAGETVFYRLFLLDACTHAPFPASRYVYVELIDQGGSVEVRQKLRPENGGMYYGSIRLSEHPAQGYYKIRAYTRLMESRGAEGFYARPVFVAADNPERLKMEMNAAATADGKRTAVELRFVNAGTGDVAAPEDVFIQLNGKRQKDVEKRDGGVFALELPLADGDRERTLYAEALLEDGSVVFKQFDIVPYTGDGVELTFYPEGGYLVEGQPNVVAFKALCKDGRPAEVRGRIVAGDSTVLTPFATLHDGMGRFFLLPDGGPACHAEYEADGRRYRTPLPALKRSPFALRCAWKDGRLLVSVNREQDLLPPPMYLLVHCRGEALYFGPWDDRRAVLALEKDALRTGVNHLILLSETYRPLSERLVFCNKNDHVRPEIKPGKPACGTREQVVMDIRLGGNGAPAEPDSLFRPSLAVSVTADSKAPADATTNILTEILLSSELAGAVANPAFYFGDGQEVEACADLLMLTHGWTRYDIPKALRGEWTVPALEAETSQTLSGRVRGKIVPRAAANVEVSLLSYKGKEKYYSVTQTGCSGLRTSSFPTARRSSSRRSKGKRKKAKRSKSSRIPSNTLWPAISASRPIP